MTKLNSLSKLALVVSAVAAFSIGCSNSPPATTSTTSSGGSSSGGTTSGGSSSGGSSSGGTTGTSTGGAALTVTPNTQAFGSVAEGATSTASVFTVKNAGTGISGPVSVTIAGNNSGDFVQSANTCGATLAVNATCTVSVTFSPSTSGNEAATLTATATPGGSASASLSGSGLAAGGVTVSPSNYPFGSVTVGQASTAQTFTFTNTGAVETGVAAVTMFGGDAAEFKIDATSNTCTAAIAPGTTCTVSVTFNPAQAGVFASSVQLIATPGAPGGVSAAVSGTGVAAAHLSVAPLVGAFGTQIESNPSSPLTFTVTNQGGVATAALTDAVTGTNLADFAISTDGCTGQILNPLGTCQILVTFTPSTVGTESATLTVTDSATDAVTVNLSGTGASATGLSIAPSPATFSSTVGTASASQTFTVTNAAGSATTGTLKATFGGNNPGDFAIVAGSDGCTGTTLAGGATCTISVTFDPTVATESATLNVAGTPGGTASATLNGTGIVGASLQAAPPALSFGSVATGTTTAAKTITISNPGGQATGVPVVTLGGANSADFTMTNGCTAQLPAGTGTCTIKVTFSPTLTATEIAQITVTATPGGTLNLSLTGVGISPAALAFETGAPAFSPTGMDFYYYEDEYPWMTFADNLGGPVTFTIINNGSQPTGALTVAIGSGAFQGSFVIAPPTGNDCVSGTTSLATGQSCTVEVSFIPLNTDLAAQNGVVFMQQNLVVTPTSGAALTGALAGYGMNLFGYSLNSTVFSDNTGYGAPELTFSSPIGVVQPNFILFYNQSCNDYNEDNGSIDCNVNCNYQYGKLYDTDITTGTPKLTGDTTDFTIDSTGAHKQTGFPNCVAGLSRSCNSACEVDVLFTPSATTPAGATATLSITGSTDGTATVQSDSFTLTGTTSSPLTVQNAGTVITSYSFDTSGNGSHNPTTVGQSSLSTTLTIDCAVANCGLVRASLDDQADFAVVTNGAADHAAFTGSATLTIAFEPKAAGSYTQHLTLAGAAGYTATVTLTGTAVTPSGVTGSVSIAPTQNNFGLQNVGTESALLTYTVTNGLATALQLSGSSTTGPIEFLTAGNAIDSSGNFTVSYPTSSSSCFTGVGTDPYATLQPGGTCQFQVAFTPPSNTAAANLGVELNDTLQLLSNPSSTTATSLVSGTPTSPLSISLTTGTDPMLQHVGDSPASSETFTIKNNGSATGSLTTTYTYVTTSGASILSNPGTTDTCNGSPLAAGGTCTITVSLLTTNAGVGVETFTVEQGTSGVYVASPKINGTVLSVANLTISPATFDFGTQAVGSATPAETFTVTNTGGTATGVLSVTPPFTQFAITANTCDAALAAGGTCQFTATFNPTAVGDLNGSITVTDSAVAVVTNVNGNGVGVVAGVGPLTISPSWFEFPSVIQSDGGSPVMTFTVHNPATGVANAPLNTAAGMIQNAAVPPAFTVVTGTGAGTCVPSSTLAAGSSCTVVVQEAITTPGTATGTADLFPSSSAGTYAVLSGNIEGEEVLAPVNGGAVTFGPPNVALGASASHTFQVKNNGVASATLGAAVLTSLSGPAAITITADTCSNTTLPGAAALPVGGNECAITVTYSPTTLTTSTAALSITGTDTAGNKSTANWGTVTPPAAGITGIGFPDATLTISPVDAGFLVSPTTDNDGGLILGDDYNKNNINGGTELVYTVYNDGGVVSAPLAVTLPAAASTATPPTGALFYVDESNSTCYGSGGGTIYVGGDAGLPNLTGCTLSVDMHAAINSSTGPNSATLQVNAASGNSNVVNVFGNVFGPVLNQSESAGSFSGTGTAASPYDFTTVTVGSASSALTVTIGNISAGYTTGLLETSLSDQSDFTITSDTCAGYTIGALGSANGGGFSGGSCAIEVVFNPTSGSVSPATITVTDTASSGAGSISFSIQGNP